MSGAIALVRDSFPGRPAFDVAVSRALLLRAARGEAPDTLRLYRPDDVVVFGRQDAASEGFSEAVQAADRHGFASVVRLAGGRAAVFHAQTIAFARALSDPDPHSRTFARFEETAEILASALASLGIDARIGEIPGEYCPGDYSISSSGVRKLVGIGQRIIRGAAHIGGVIVVSGADRVRSVLRDVYRALGLSWDPATAGAVTDEVETSWEEVAGAIVEEFSARYQVLPEGIDPVVLEAAGAFEADHEVGSQVEPDRPRS